MKKTLASLSMAAMLQSHHPAVVTLLDNVQIYDSVATTYDELDNGYLPEALGLNRLRDKLGSLVEGDVLEVGIGTGIQLPHYSWQKIHSFTGLDASSKMLQEAQYKLDRIRQDHPKISMKLVQSDAENMQQLSANDQVSSKSPLKAVIS